MSKRHSAKGRRASRREPRPSPTNGHSAQNPSKRQASESSGDRTTAPLPSIGRLSLSEIVGDTSVVEFTEARPLLSLLCQMTLLSVVTAGAGTLTAKFVPDASPSGIGNGVYVFGVVLLLIVEAAYQWLLRAAILPIEHGAVIISEQRFPSHSPSNLRSALETARDTNEARLNRVLEPLRGTVLVALALSLYFIVQGIGNAPTPPAWLETLSKDWAMTLLFAFAGLLWQLKNPDNIGKLLEHLKIQSRFSAFGERFWVLALVVPSIGSMAVISGFFFPWGIATLVPLVVFIWAFVRFRSSRRLCDVIDKQERT